MATRTFDGSTNTLWSLADNWDTGVPVDGDAFIIPTGLQCLFDVDQSAWVTGLAASQINGTGELIFPTDGTYVYMKLAAAITGTGKMTIGTDGTPIPAPAAGGEPAIVTIDLMANGSLNCSGASTIVGRNRTLFDTVAVGCDAGQTDIVLTNGLELQQHDIVRISRQAIGNNSRTGEIASYNAGTKTLTLTAGVAAAVAAGDYVAIQTSNIRITKNGNYQFGTSWAGRSMTGVLLENTNAAGNNLLSSTSLWTFTGCIGIITSAGYYSWGSTHGNSVWNNCVGMAQSGWVSNASHCALADCLSFLAGYGDTAVTNSKLDTCVVANAANRAHRYLDSHLKDCSFYYTNSPITTPAAQPASRCVFESCATLGCDTDLTNLTSAELLNCLLAGTSAEFSGYNDYTKLMPYDIVVSRDHDQVADAVKAWCLGDITTKQGTTYPTGKTYSYQIALASATYWGFYEEGVWVEPGDTLTMTFWVRRDMASPTETPLVELVCPGSDPLKFSDESALDSYTMTGGADAWETGTLTWTNTSEYRREVTIRCRAKNASGNVYVLWEQEMPEGGGIGYAFAT